MLKTIGNLKGVTVLSKDAQKKIKGKGACGVRVDGTWIEVGDYDSDGRTIDDAKDSLGTWTDGESGETVVIDRWCCDSCPWN